MLYVLPFRILTLKVAGDILILVWYSIVSAFSHKPREKKYLLMSQNTFWKSDFQMSSF